MRPSSLALALALVFAVGVAGSGCATKIYQGPTSGRAAEAQIAVATSADRAFERFDVRPFAGKRVLVEVYGLTERLEGESPEEAYVRGTLVEKLLRGGATLASDLDQAQVLLVATLKAAGVDVIRRDVPFIYNHHTFRGLTSARLVAYNVSNRMAGSILSAQQIDAEAYYIERYIFYFIGPIRSRE